MKWPFEIIIKFGDFFLGKILNLSNQGKNNSKLQELKLNYNIYICVYIYIFGWGKITNTSIKILTHFHVK